MLTIEADVVTFLFFSMFYYVVGPRVHILVEVVHKTTQLFPHSVESLTKSFNESITERQYQTNDQKFDK